jgi:hypothetical protein
MARRARWSQALQSGQSARVDAPDPVAEHSRSSHHRDAIEESDEVGCFYCCRIYDAREIVAWTDAVGGVSETALCPKCGIDAVIPIREGIDHVFLLMMHSHWFSRRPK